MGELKLIEKRAPGQWNIGSKVDIESDEHPFNQYKVSQ